MKAKRTMLEGLSGLLLAVLRKSSVSHVFIKINVARSTHGDTFGEENENFQPIINSSFNK